MFCLLVFLACAMPVAAEEPVPDEILAGYADKTHAEVLLYLTAEWAKVKASLTFGIGLEGGAEIEANLLEEQDRVYALRQKIAILMRTVDGLEDLYLEVNRVSHSLKDRRVYQPHARPPPAGEPTGLILESESD